MATRNKAVQAAVAAASPKPNTKPGKGTVPVAYLTLSGKQPVKAYRANSARALYWASAVVQLKGGTLPLATVYAAWASKPPTTPKSGKAEPPAGWVAYFVRCGLVQITTRHVAAK